MRLRVLVLACLMICAIGCSSGGNPKVSSFFNETPIDETSSIMTFSMNDVGGGSVAGRSMELMCECARITLEKGFAYFLVENQMQEEGGESSFRITFFKEPPEGMPVFSMDSEPENMGDDDEVVMEAETYAQLCEMIKGKK